jgi:23S rRNA pseudouridine2605 synthase
MIRLNKLLADRGVAARRKCDALIEQGSVRVDGEVVREPGTRVDPDRQRVTVQGKALSAAKAHVYYALHKPTGVLTTMSDPAGRPTVRAYLPARGPRVFPVGRLDGDTSGLLLLTSDGALAHRLMHPRYQIPKTYQLALGRMPSARALAQLGLGVEFAPGEVSRPAQVEVLERDGECARVALTIAEGRNRQVRRMCDALALELLALRRVRVGPVELGELPEGALRNLTREEVTALRKAVAQPPAPGGAVKGRVTAGRAHPAKGKPWRRPRGG